MVEHLGKVFRKLEEANLKLKPQEFKFMQKKIEYLGHTLTAEGVCSNDGKVQAVREFPRPKTVKEVKTGKLLHKTLAEPGSDCPPIDSRVSVPTKWTGQKSVNMHSTK